MPSDWVCGSRKKFESFMESCTSDQVDALSKIFRLSQVRRIDADTLSSQELDELRGKGWYMLGQKWLTRPSIPRKAIPQETTVQALISDLGISERIAVHALRAYSFHECLGVWTLHRQRSVSSKQAASTTKIQGKAIAVKLKKKDPRLKWHGTLDQAKIFFQEPRGRTLAYALSNMYGPPILAYSKGLRIWNTEPADKATRRSIYKKHKELKTK